MVVASAPAACAIPLPLSTRTEMRERGRRGRRCGIATCPLEARAGSATGRVPCARKRSMSAPTAMRATARSKASASVTGRHENDRLIGWTCSTDRHGSPGPPWLLLLLLHPLPRAGDAGRDRRLGLPAQFSPGAGSIEDAMPEVARPFGREPGLLLNAGRLRAQPVQLGDARRDAAGDVVDALSLDCCE